MGGGSSFLDLVLVGILLPGLYLMKIATAQRTPIPYLPVISFGLKGDNHARFALPRAAAIFAEKPSGSCQRFHSLSGAEYGFACLDACREFGCSVAIFQVVQLHQCQSVFPFSSDI